jgi:phage gpG-like protein
MASVGGSGPGWLSITIDDGRTSEVLSRRFALYGHQVGDMTRPMTLIGTDLLADNLANFATEGRLYGGAVGHAGMWAPLRPSTIRDRMRRGYGPGPILHRTGEMEASLTSRHHPGNVFAVTPTSVTVGTRDRKAIFHQLGTRKMAARAVVGFTWERRQGIWRRLSDHVAGVIQGDVQGGIIP